MHNVCFERICVLAMVLCIVPVATLRLLLRGAVVRLEQSNSQRYARLEAVPTGVLLADVYE